jgi:hypothetical protein
MRLGDMPLINDYSLCQQTVTIYRKTGDGVSREVVYPAFLDFKKTETVDRTGSSEANSFLLVIPGGSVPVAVGDKVVDGVGEDVPDGDSLGWWRNFIPTKRPFQIGVVSTVDVKRWHGEICHVEAGG